MRSKPSTSAKGSCGNPPEVTGNEHRPSVVPRDLGFGQQEKHYELRSNDEGAVGRSQIRKRTVRAVMVVVDAVFFKHKTNFPHRIKHLAGQ